MEATESGQTPSDLELLSLARQGRWDAFETLVARFEPRVFGMAWRILQQREDAEDATQQTFLSVMEHLDRFREESSVATWVLRIATNHSLKLLRKRRGLVTVPLETTSRDSGDDGEPLPHPDYIAQWQDDPADLAQRAEIRALLNEALAEIDEKHRLGKWDGGLFMASPRLGTRIDPAERRAFPAGALITRWTSAGCPVLIRTCVDRRLMRLSRISRAIPMSS